MRLIEALRRPLEYPVGSWENDLVHAFDYLAVAGSMLGVALAARAAWRVRGHLRFVIPALGVFGFALTGTASVDVFQDVFSHARLLSPLTLLLAAEGLPRRDWLAGAPIVAAAGRIAILHAAHLLRIVRALHAGG